MLTLPTSQAENSLGKGQSVIRTLTALSKPSAPTAVTAAPVSPAAVLNCPSMSSFLVCLRVACPRAPQCDGCAVVSFTANFDGGEANNYTVQSSPGGVTAVGRSSPITVTGLQNGVSYSVPACLGSACSVS
jgi:hypothetical protein